MRASPLLGAHQSIAGGLPLSIDRALATGCAALQIFTTSRAQWRPRPLPRGEVRTFRRRVAVSGLGPIVSHGSYLINVAAPDAAVRRRSIAALGQELDRAEALGLYGIVMHPGAYTTGREASGLRRIGDALRTVLASRREGRTLLLLEHTAGQGTALGHRFEHLATILDRLDRHTRVAVCLDTCHLFAAGYDLRSPAGYADTFERFDAIVGLDRLKAFHLNDAARPLGSRIDRHTHIGQGEIGLAAFRRLLNDPRFASLPMVLETPKTGRTSSRSVAADPSDLRNLGVLRGLLDSRTG